MRWRDGRVFVMIWRNKNYLIIINFEYINNYNSILKSKDNYVPANVRHLSS